MRVLVCGGRDFTDKALLYNTLYALCEEFGLKSEPDEYGNWLPNNLTIIHGAAPGADSLADDWAIVNWCPFQRYPADWNAYGKAAGPIRNRQMLAEGHPDIVIAFPTPKSRGTWDMVNISTKAGVPVRVITPVEAT
jgi:hypothetical protein